MAKVYAELDERLRKFIVVQPIFPRVHRAVPIMGPGAGARRPDRSDHPAPVRDPHLL